MKKRFVSRIYYKKREKKIKKVSSNFLFLLVQVNFVLFWVIFLLFVGEYKCWRISAKLNDLVDKCVSHFRSHFFSYLSQRNLRILFRLYWDTGTYNWPHNNDIKCHLIYWDRIFEDDLGLYSVPPFRTEANA